MKLLSLLLIVSQIFLSSLALTAEADSKKCTKALAISGQAEPLLQQILKKYPLDRPNSDGVGFLAPNETHPYKIQSLISNAPKGVHIAVGTERGFIGAALNPGASSLLLIDIDPKVIQFNRLNTLLLKISTSLDDYWRLRLEANYAQVYQQATQIKLNVSKDELLMLSNESWKWWADHVRSDNWSTFYQDPRESSNSTVPFKNAHYLYYPDQFLKVQSLAKNDQIVSIKLDLKDQSSILDLADLLARQKISISVFDISNAWEYMPFETFKQVLSWFSSATQPGSLCIVTKQRRLQGSFTDQNFRQQATQIEEDPWEYMGVRFATDDQSAKSFETILNNLLRPPTSRTQNFENRRSMRFGGSYDFNPF